MIVHSRLIEVQGLLIGVQDQIVEIHDHRHLGVQDQIVEIQDHHHLGVQDHRHQEVIQYHHHLRV